MPTKDTAPYGEKLWRMHGLDYENRGDQLVGDCPFCGGEAKLHANPESALWDCKSCGRSGNGEHFLQELVETAASNVSNDPLSIFDTPAEQLRRHRAEKAGLSPTNLPGKSSWNRVLLASGLLPHPVRQGWIAPVYAPTKKSLTSGRPDWRLVNLRVYDDSLPKPRFMTSPREPGGMKRQQPWFVGSPDNLPNNPSCVWIAEGEWDALTLHYLVNGPRNPETWEHIVIGVPGAGGLDTTGWSWLGKQITGGSLPVRVVCDNDDAGLQHATKIAEALQGSYSADAKLLKWDKDCPEKYDLSDAIYRPDSPFAQDLPESKTRRAKHILVWGNVTNKAFVKGLQGKGGRFKKDGASEAKRTAYPARTYDQVLQTFEETQVRVTPQIADSLWVAGACVFSSREHAVQPWTLLVGPPGSGKSLVLETFSLLSTSASEPCYYQTSLARKSLLSGYNSGGGDPSILGDLTDPSKCLVIKDWTTITDMSSQDRADLLRILREAFDGSINQRFGNGANRVFEGKFGIVAGVTPLIYGLQDADVGARFLYFRLSGSLQDQEKVLFEALTGGENTVKSPEKLQARREAVAGWIEGALQNKPETPITLTDEEKHDLISLAYFVAFGRAVVERCRVENDPTTEAYTETPTRVAQQLSQTLIGLRTIAPERPLEDSLRVVVQVAMDTGYSRKTPIFRALLEKPHTADELAKRFRLSKTFCARALDDLFQLRIADTADIRTTPGAGRSSKQFRILEWFEPHRQRLLELTNRFNLNNTLLCPSEADSSKPKKRRPKQKGAKGRRRHQSKNRFTRK